MLTRRIFLFQWFLQVLVYEVVRAKWLLHLCTDHRAKRWFDLYIYLLPPLYRGVASNPVHIVLWVKHLISWQVAPSGQEYFKQSNTRLHFIASRAMDMTGELFNDPWEILESRYRSFFIPFANNFWDTVATWCCIQWTKSADHRLRMTELISALGLRHVGYGIPTELVGPFANCFVEVLRENAPGEDAALEGFEWSIKLVAKILIRVIQEGSTIVMKVGKLRPKNKTL